MSERRSTGAFQNHTSSKYWPILSLLQHTNAEKRYRAPLRGQRSLPVSFIFVDDLIAINVSTKSG